MNTTTRKTREQAPKLVVRTRDTHGQWTARYVCTTRRDAATRWGHLVATGHVTDVLDPQGAGR